MREIDMAAPDLGLGDGGTVVPLVQPDGRYLDGIDVSGMEPWEVNAFVEVMAEVDAMTPAELAELEAEGAADLEGWAEGEPGRQLSNDGGYLDFSRQLDEDYELSKVTGLLQLANEREAIRVRQNAERPARRDEDRLSRSLARLQAHTYMQGGLGLSNDFDELLEAGPAPTAGEVRDQLWYELTGLGQPVAARYREPLPPVHDLSRKIGLR